MQSLPGGPFLSSGLYTTDALQRRLLLCKRRPIVVRRMPSQLLRLDSGRSRVHALRRRLHLAAELPKMRHLRAVGLGSRQVQVLL